MADWMHVGCPFSVSSRRVQRLHCSSLLRWGGYRLLGNVYLWTSVHQCRGSEFWDTETQTLFDWIKKKAIESRKLGDIILLTIPVFRFGSTARVPGKPSTPRWSPISARSERSRWGALSLVGSSVWITGFLEVGSNWSSQLWELYIYYILYI